MGRFTHPPSLCLKGGIGTWRPIVQAGTVGSFQVLGRDPSAGTGRSIQRGRVRDPYLGPILTLIGADFGCLFFCDSLGVSAQELSEAPTFIPTW